MTAALAQSGQIADVSLRNVVKSSWSCINKVYVHFPPFHCPIHEDNHLSVKQQIIFNLYDSSEPSRHRSLNPVTTRQTDRQKMML